MRTFLFYLITFLCICPSAEAQTWKWAKEILGSQAFYWDVSQSTGIQHFADLTSDPWGNAYFLGNGGDQFQINGSSVAGYSKEDIIVTSFSCNGQYRWSKVIGSTNDSEKAYAIRTDNFGGVYLIAEMRGSQQRSIGTDTLMNADNRTMYLVKLDTAGRYQWLRMPQPDTISFAAAARQSQMLDFDVDEQGGVHILAFLTPGIYGGNYVATSRQAYVLKYSSAGQFLGGISLPLNTTSQYLNGAYDWRLTYSGSGNRYVVKGKELSSTSIGGTTIPSNASFIAAFNAGIGSLQWIKYGANYQVIINQRAVQDKQGDLFVAGQADSNQINGKGVFNGVSLSEGPYVMKISGTNGNPIWTLSGRQSYTNTFFEPSQAYCMSMLDQKLLVGGSFRDTVFFGSQKLTSSYTLDSMEGFLLEVDAATGTLSKALRLGGPRMDKGISLMSTAQKHSVYMSAPIGNPINIGGTVVQNNGIYRGYFLAKYGYNNCNCAAPTPNYASTVQSGNTIRYTYTGTTAGLNRLLWDFGDGQTQTVSSSFTTPINHTYSGNGHYTACVTATNDTCAEATYCKQASVSVAEIQSGGILVYPNPGNDYLAIEGALGSTAVVFNTLGQKMQQFDIKNQKQTISISTLPAGTYMLQLQWKNMNPVAVRFIKQ